MFVIVGSLVVIGSVVAGYTMHGGHMLVLFQVTEFIIIGGAAIGALLISNPISVTKRLVRGVIGTLKGSKINKKSYEELLRTLYSLLQMARRDGVIALEPHIESPSKSEIFKKAPTLLANHHALSFLCDTLRTMVSGSSDPHELDDLMEKDLETMHEEELTAPAALTSLGDSLPGLGIVAAVLGIVITMGEIDRPPAEIGQSVAGALVGTFIGILACYGFVGPLAKNMEHMIAAEGRYFGVIKAALVAFARGPAPAVVIEYARRAIMPEERPSFESVEKMLAGKG
jgi:chemotaxis protein MotA